MRACGFGSWCLAALLASSGAAAQAPPGTGTDLEIDPDAPPPPAEPASTEPPPLPPVGADAWGVGGKDEEGRFAPGAQKPKGEEEAEDKGPLVLGAPGSFGVDMVIGFGKIRDVANDANTTSMTVFSFLVEGQYRFGETWAVGVSFPYATGSIAGPGGGIDDYNTFATGNLELAARPTFHVNHRLSIPVHAAFFVPMASGDLFASAEDQGAVAQALVNQASASARGYEINPSFASKRAGISLGVGAGYDKDALHLGVSTKLDVMFKTGGNEPPKEVDPVNQGALQDPSTTWVTGLAGSYDFLDGKVSPGLRMWLAANTVPVRVGGTREYSGAQLVLEPQVNGELPLNQAKDLFVSGGLGFLLPLGGHLGGADGGSVNGLRVQAALLF